MRSFTFTNVATAVSNELTFAVEQETVTSLTT